MFPGALFWVPSGLWGSWEIPKGSLGDLHGFPAAPSAVSWGTVLGSPGHPLGSPGHPLYGSPGHPFCVPFTSPLWSLSVYNALPRRKSRQILSPVHPPLPAFPRTPILSGFPRASTLSGFHRAPFWNSVWDSFIKAALILEESHLQGLW